MFTRPRSSRKTAHRFTLFAAAVMATTLGMAPSNACAAQVDWSTGGHDLANSRSASAEHKITKNNASRLKDKWTYATHGDVSATPAVVGGGGVLPRLGRLPAQDQREDRQGDLVAQGLRVHR